MKTLKLYFITALLAIVGSAHADQLQVENFTIEPGETKTISVELYNPDNSYIMLEFNLSLPEGISIDRETDGELMVTPNSNRLTRTHVLDIEEKGGGEYKVLIYSTRNSALAGQAGEIFSVTLTASSSIPTGTYQGRFHNLVFANTDRQEVNPLDSTFEIEVGTSLNGDVNGDGQITIADVTALVNIILGKDNAEPHLYDHEAADVNGDGTVTIADVTALVNRILGK